MTKLAPPSVKGWCPGALRPMASGDGLVVRVRPRCGAFSLPEIAALAGAAAEHGNGHIDVTRRANLQIRGVTEASFPKLIEELAQLGLLDGSAGAEAIRNIMVAPLLGLDPVAVDVRPSASALETLLASDTALQALPSKFGYAIDGGGALSLLGERADIVMAALHDAGSFAIGLDTANGTRWLGRVGAAKVVPAVAALAHAFLDALGGATQGRMRDVDAEQIDRIAAAAEPLLQPLEADEPRAPKPALSRIGHLELGSHHHVAGFGAPFGRLEAHQLTRLAEIVADAGGADVRLSPWRVLYAGVRDGAAANPALHEAATAGFITEADDPLLHVEACSGAPDCPSASLDTRGAARLIAAQLSGAAFSGTVHISGCWKGCARSAPADLTLVAQGECYLVIRGGTASGEPIASVSPVEVQASPRRVLDLVMDCAHV